METMIPGVEQSARWGLTWVQILPISTTCHLRTPKRTQANEDQWHDRISKQLINALLSYSFQLWDREHGRLSWLSIHPTIASMSPSLSKSIHSNIVPSCCNRTSHQPDRAQLWTLRAPPGSQQGLCLMGYQHATGNFFFHLVYLHLDWTETEIHTAYLISYPRKKWIVSKKAILTEKIQQISTLSSAYY
jgi:hypothetical protein